LLASVGGKPLLCYALRALEVAPWVREIVVVGREQDRERIAALCRRESFTKVKVVAPGGEVRQESVRLGLEALQCETPLVVVHDAARPFLPLALLERCLREAARSGAAIAALPCPDTLKAARERAVVRTVNRAGVWLSQTPQVFRRALLLEAHGRARRYRYLATDDAALLERAGHTVTLVPSTALNFKVTTPEDLEMARLIARDGNRLKRVLGWSVWP